MSKLKLNEKADCILEAFGAKDHEKTHLIVRDLALAYHSDGCESFTASLVKFLDKHDLEKEYALKLGSPESYVLLGYLFGESKRLYAKAATMAKTIGRTGILSALLDL